MAPTIQEQNTKVYMDEAISIATDMLSKTLSTLCNTEAEDPVKGYSAAEVKAALVLSGFSRKLAEGPSLARPVSGRARKLR